jgi:hypothetical protein
VLFRIGREVAGIRDDGKLGVCDKSEALKSVFEAHKIAVSDGDEDGRFD